MSKRRSGRWVDEHRADPFVRKALSTGYRARSAFKLLEIDDRDKLLSTSRFVVDLGSAPGAWSQIAAERIRPGGRVFALDILEMPPLPDVDFIQGDFREADVLANFNALLAGRKVDLVMSDMAPNMGGIRVVDQARSMELAELAVEFAFDTLTAEGNFLVKHFHGSGVEEYMKMLRKSFSKVLIRKPDASRSRSREIYALGRGYRV